MYDRSTLNDGGRWKLARKSKFKDEIESGTKVYTYKSGQLWIPEAQLQNRFHWDGKGTIAVDEDKDLQKWPFCMEMIKYSNGFRSDGLG